MKRISSLLLRFFLLSLVVLLGCQCASKKNSEVLVSVRDQKLAVIQEGQVQKIYPVSTSKFGLGTRSGSNKTPIGRFEVAKMIGDNAPAGAVFKSRRRTGEVLKPNAPGRDPIVTRILWLRGTEWRTRNTFDRCIYIHGTPEEKRIGSPASYGCVRMKSNDIIRLFDDLEEGASVRITTAPIPRRGRSVAPPPVIEKKPKPSRSTPIDNAPPLPEVMPRSPRYATNS